MFSGWFRSTPEPLPPVNIPSRNQLLIGAASNIKLLYKYLHEHANLTKSDEHLRQTRLDIMFEILDDIKYRLEKTGFDEPEIPKSESIPTPFRRCNTDLRRTTPITIPSASSSSTTPPTPLADEHPKPPSLSSTPPNPHLNKHQNPPSYSNTPPKSFFFKSSTPHTSPRPQQLDKRSSSPNLTKEPPRRPPHLMITPPLSPKPQKHICTQTMSPKPRRRPTPLCIESQSPMPAEEEVPSYDAILHENNQLKRKLVAANAARKSLESLCSTIGRDNGTLSQELGRTSRELEEADETVHELMDMNRRIYVKLSEEDNDVDVNAELMATNKQLADRILKAGEDYKAVVKKLKEAMALDGRIASEMGSCVEMLCKVRHERILNDRCDPVRTKKLLTKIECFLMAWQGRLIDSPLRKIN